MTGPGGLKSERRSDGWDKIVHGHTGDRNLIFEDKCKTFVKETLVLRTQTKANVVFENAMEQIFP